MSIIVNNLSYTHPNREPLFSNVSFSVADGEKASLIGDNGCGKSTLLHIIAGNYALTQGELSLSSTPCFIPQHFGQYNGMTIAEALGLGDKVAALHAILAGDASPDNYAILDDDWEIEERVKAALSDWGLADATPDTPMSSLSGGGKTKVFLSGISIRTPEIVLMDEPTNHLDRPAREKLYRLIEGSRKTMLVVSHDRELLNIVDTTFELTPDGINRYGGNYDFYKEQYDIRINALNEHIAESDKAIRAAQRKARQAAERKERNDARGERKQKQAGVARILMNTIRDGAEKSASRLKDKHSAKIENLEQERRALRDQRPDDRNLKIAIDSSTLHKGKTLVRAKGVNFSYRESAPLWNHALDLLILSGDRIAILGGNGSGKTTLIKLITGILSPMEGTVERADFSYQYIDQEYSMIDNSLTVLQQLESRNTANLPDHELKTELHRFLFPASAWDKPCAGLSGGEKMRLMLCCMVVSNDSPDMIILDEPTNNLDIRSMEILTDAMAGYGGTVLVISHDSHFLDSIGVDRHIDLGV